MTLFELFCALREKLIEATENVDRGNRESKEMRLLDELMTTFTILEEVTSYDHKKFRRACDNMTHHIINFTAGTPWKAPIPSIETLKGIAEDNELESSIPIIIVHMCQTAVAPITEIRNT